MTIPILLSQSQVQALGWMLLHFVWQGVVVAAVVAIARGVLINPRLRYGSACAALLAMVLLPLAPFLSDQADTPSGPTPSGPVNELSLGKEPTVTPTAQVFKVFQSRRIETLVYESWPTFLTDRRSVEGRWRGYRQY